MSQKHRSSVISAGLALFSMFFGAGDLIWPLIIGGNSGDMNFWTVSGFMITAVTLPLLGLCGMLLYMGDYYDFFSKIGKIPCFIMVFIIQAIVGPVGSIPRLYTLAHATLQPYLPGNMELFPFSILATLVVLAFIMRKNKIVDILGIYLSPFLLLSIAVIIVLGFINPPAAPASTMVAGEAFNYGLIKGYNTLDLIASFIFAPMVLSYFCADTEGLKTVDARKSVVKRMFQASLIAAGLLTTMYLCLTYLASYYVPLLPPNTPNEGRLAAIAMHLLGEKGAFVSCLAVVMVCLTTAIPLTAIAADYFKKDIFQNKVGDTIPLAITLVISLGLANLGFMGIANMLEPVLQTMCPILIVLCIYNIYVKLYREPVVSEA